MLDEDLGFALNLSFFVSVNNEDFAISRTVASPEATFRGIHNLLDILVSLFLFWAIYVTKLIDG